MDDITRQEESYNDARFNESYEHRYGGEPEEEKPRCKFCGDPVDETAQFVDACSFCIAEMKDVLTYPLKNYGGNIISAFEEKGIYATLQALFESHMANEYDLICLIEEVVDRKSDELWEKMKVKPEEKIHGKK